MFEGGVKPFSLKKAIDIFNTYEKETEVTLYCGRLEVRFK